MHPKHDQEKLYEEMNDEELHYEEIQLQQQKQDQEKKLMQKKHEDYDENAEEEARSREETQATKAL